MCYTGRCIYECKYGEHEGDCRKPHGAICPEDIEPCEKCGGKIEDDRVDDGETVCFKCENEEE